MTAYLAALAVTLLVEVPVYVAVLGPGSTVLRAPRVATRPALATGLLANLASHPAAFLVAQPLLRRLVSRTAALAIVEVLVLLVEAAVVQRRHGDPALAALAAGTANLASLTVAALIA